MAYCYNTFAIEAYLKAVNNKILEGKKHFIVRSTSEESEIAPAFKNVEITVWEIDSFENSVKRNNVYKGIHLVEPKASDLLEQEMKIASSVIVNLMEYYGV